VLAGVHPRFHVPHRAEVAVGFVVATAVLLADLRDAIGFSSFAVLLYYAIANACALTLRSKKHPWTPVFAIVGFAGCVAMSISLPLRSTIAGASLALLGVIVYAIKRRWRAASL
jgi:basic amino acid/polyamine antiporter, APA family